MKFDVFTEADMAFLAPLEPEGWGDLQPRFRFFLDSPFCFPLKLMDAGHIAGLGAGIVFESTAWLACIIVHPAYRNRGLGAVITNQLIDCIDKSRIHTISLIATDMGYPLYHKLGFIEAETYLHYQLNPLALPLSVTDNIIRFDEQYTEPLKQMDTIFSNENRSALLNRYLQDSLLYVEEGELKGYYIPGISEGTIVASHPEAGLALMKIRMQEKQTIAFPEINTVARDRMKQAGIEPFRISRRMYIGKKLEWKPELLFNRISGQLG